MRVEPGVKFRGSFQRCRAIGDRPQAALFPIDPARARRWRHLAPGGDGFGVPLRAFERQREAGTIVHYGVGRANRARERVRGLAWLTLPQVALSDSPGPERGRGLKAGAICGELSHRGFIGQPQSLQ